MSERDTLDSIPVNPGNTPELAYKDSGDQDLFFPRCWGKKKSVTQGKFCTINCNDYASSVTQIHRSPNT